MNPNNRDSQQQNYGRYNPQTGVGGYMRRYPKQMMTPPPPMWEPVQPPGGTEFGPAHYNVFNNPVPFVHHHQAALSSGRRVRLPALGELEKAWSDNMLQDGMRMYVTPDPTLTGTLTGAATFPQQLPGCFWVPYNAKDQLGGGHI